jgi:hypothetical protein
MSLTVTPSACALRRSMSRWMDGLVAVKVEKTRAIRGSALAAPISAPVTLEIAAGVCHSSA